MLEAADHRQAVQFCRRLTGRGVSAQAYALRQRILEVDAARDGRTYEVHPEVSYWSLAGSVLPGKRTAAGRAVRRALLEEAGLLPAVERLPGAGPDDVLAAAVAAWSAGRIASGRAGCLPDPPEMDERGRPTAIWY